MNYINHKLPLIQQQICIPWGERLTAALKLKEVNRHDSDDEEEQNSETLKNTQKNAASPIADSIVVTSMVQGEAAEAETTHSTTSATPEEVLNEINITVSFDWESFGEMFQMLMGTGGQELLDRVLESMIGEHCVQMLLNKLLEYCDPARGDCHVRRYLQKEFKRYIIKYSSDPREWGQFKDGVLCDVIELEIGEKENEMSWVFRDITQNLETTTEVQIYLVQSYYLPKWEGAIKSIMGKRIALEVDWDSISYAAIDYGKAIYSLYFDKSAFVLEEIYRAFEWISSFEADELVDAIAYGLSSVKVVMQPGPDATRKDFDVYDKEKNKTQLILQMCLEADEFAGTFRYRRLVDIIKLAGLYNSDFTELFRCELLAAAASLNNVVYGDLKWFNNVLEKPIWWKPNELEDKGFRVCMRYVDYFYKEAFKDWRKNNKAGGGGDDDDMAGDDELGVTSETFVRGWHMIKFNKNNHAQERLLVLTNKAYWTFKYDFKTGKFDEKHYKRHDLLDFSLADVGPLVKADKEVVLALKIFTQEKRKKDFLGRNIKEVAEKPVSKDKIPVEIRRSLNLARGQIFSVADGNALPKMDSTLRRVKKKKPDRTRPPTEGCYSAVFIPHSVLSNYPHKDFLSEIAWCVYAYSVARQQTKGTEPFISTETTLSRPKGGLSSFLYNTLKLGVQKKAELRHVEVNSKDGFGATASGSPINTPRYVIKGTGVLKDPSKRKPGDPKHNRRVIFAPNVTVFRDESDEEEDAPDASSEGFSHRAVSSDSEDEQERPKMIASAPAS